MSDTDDQLPTRARRNPAKYWTAAAIAFAFIAIIGGGLFYALGPNDWFSDYRFAAAADSELLIELNRDQDRRTLPDGTEYFAASGTVINPTDREQAVPPMLVVLRDAGGRVVFSWKMKPPVSRLAPGGRASFNEAKLDVPRAANQLEVGWADRSGG